MSTTRWIIWCEPHHAEGETTEGPCAFAWESTVDELCRMVKRVLVDPDNLPPEAIQRAVNVSAEHRPGVGPVTDRKRVEAIITAFLSDPEPGDQT